MFKLWAIQPNGGWAKAHFFAMSKNILAKLNQLQDQSIMHHQAQKSANKAMEQLIADHFGIEPFDVSVFTDELQGDALYVTIETYMLPHDSQGVDKQPTCYRKDTALRELLQGLNKPDFSLHDFFLPSDRAGKRNH